MYMHVLQVLGGGAYSNCSCVSIHNPHYCLILFLSLIISGVGLLIGGFNMPDTVLHCHHYQCFRVLLILQGRAVWSMRINC